MHQKHALIAIAAVVLFILGGVVAWDIQKKQKSSPANKNVTNWNWDDSWKTEKAETPPPKSEAPAPAPAPKPPVTEPKKVQLVAGSFVEAQKISAEQGMPILVMFTADYCGWCTEMKKKTLPDPKVAELMKNYVFVMVDTEKDRGTPIEFRVSGLPSYAITNARKDHLKTGNGYLTPDKFAKWLDNPNLFSQPKMQEIKDKRLNILPERIRLNR